jgi:hypothetical protein
MVHQKILGIRVPVDNLHYVVEPMRVGHAQDDRFLAQVNEAEAIIYVDIRRYLARLA